MSKQEYFFTHITDADILHRSEFGRAPTCWRAEEKYQRIFSLPAVTLGSNGMVYQGTEEIAQFATAVVSDENVIEGSGGTFTAELIIKNPLDSDGVEEKFGVRNALLPVGDVMYFAKYDFAKKQFIITRPVLGDQQAAFMNTYYGIKKHMGENVGDFYQNTSPRYLPARKTA